MLSHKECNELASIIGLNIMQYLPDQPTEDTPSTVAQLVGILEIQKQILTDSLIKSVTIVENIYERGN